LLEIRDVVTIAKHPCYKAWLFVSYLPDYMYGLEGNTKKADNQEHHNAKPFIVQPSLDTISRFNSQYDAANDEQPTHGVA
jgi:hypothetical protein